MFKRRRLNSGHAQDDRTGFKLAPFFLVIFITTSLIWVVLPTAIDPPAMPKPVSDVELLAATKPFAASDSFVPSSLSSRDLALAQFGRKLFFDPKFSANGKISCSTCHKPELAFTDGLRFSQGISQTGRSAPTILNSAGGVWFFWDGRVDSLAAQALQPIESPAEHGVSRSFVAGIIMTEYLKEYEALFGSWPTALGGEFPKDAMPRPKRRQMPVSVSAYGLQTIGNFDVLASVLDKAEENGIAPAEELAARAAAVSSVPAKWVEVWESLGVDVQGAINQVFANFGQSIEAFEKGIVATDSPFDQFVAKLATGSGTEESFNPKFARDELAGFRLFIGRGRCSSCHAGPLFSDQQFHNTGLKGRPGPGEIEIDLGRAQGVLDVADDVFNCLGPYLGGASLPSRAQSESCLELPYLASNNIEFVGAFKTPTLRNIAATAPYGHDGRFADLREVLAHYSKLGQKPQIGHQEDSLQPVSLKPAEIEQMEKFLRSLSSPVKDLSSGLFIEQSQ
jgi:cytochrome c peroxidase